MKRTLTRILWLYILFSAGVAPLIAADTLVSLTGHVPKEVQTATLLGSAPADEPVQLSLVVQLDPSLMNQTLTQLYSGNAQKSAHFLSPMDFAGLFNLAEKRAAITAFAQANGLTVNPNDQPESMIVHVSGSASAVQQAFGLQLNHYRGTDGQVFRAPASDPMIPSSLTPHLSAVEGLSNRTGGRRPHILMVPTSAQAGTKTSSLASPHAGLSGATGPAGGLAPNDIKTIYGLSSSSLNGSGQSVAIFELDGFNPTDIALYESTFNLPNVTVKAVSVDGTPNLCGASQNQPCNAATFSTDGGMAEVALDIEMVEALAPNVSQILVYEDVNTDQGTLDNYNQIATDNSAKVVSTSWGGPETEQTASFLQSEAAIFQRMATQGQTIYAASGDNGAYDDPNNPTTPTVDDPASQANVAGVGGTSLSGSVQSFTETVWNDTFGASGGGVSTITTLPSYQTGVAGTASQKFRNVPDVALNADPNSGYTICVAGSCTTGLYGGTSAAAPLWTGFTTLINQQNAANGLSSFGLANTVLYPLATGGSYNSIFNDVTSGNNDVYSAGPGYDNATGWGSYKGGALINAVELLSPVVQQQEQLSTLSNVYAYPNPWDTRKDTQRKMTFANLPNGATVKIFTISGFLVKTLTASNGNATWDLTNDSGQFVASGLYLFLAQNGGINVRGKVAIIK